MSFPLRHSTVERPVQHSAGIFQFGTAQLVPSVEVLTLAGAMATATGAPLGDREFDVHTWLRERFVALDCPESHAVPFTVSALERDLYGPSSKSGTTRKLLLGALQNLLDATVTIPAFDAVNCRIDPDAVASGLRLLEGIVTRGHYETLRATLARGEQPAIADYVELGRMRSDATIVAMLPRWSAAAITKGLGAPLDLDAQRELGGVAKRLWIQLNAQEFTADGTDLERLTLELDEQTYAALGFNHTRPVDRKRYLNQALQRIAAADPTYLPSSCVDTSSKRAPHLLNVQRCIGQTRQARLRDRHVQRTNLQERLPL